MRNTRWIGFGVLAMFSLTAVLLSLYLVQMSGVLVYDANYEVFAPLPDRTARLSDGEAEGILRSARAAALQAVIPLTAVVAVWLATSFLFLRRNRAFSPGQSDDHPSTSAAAATTSRKARI